MTKKKEKNWREFYLQGLAPKEPTDFCRFIMSLNLPADSVVDLGCGNGRDTKMLAEKYMTIGIDKNFELEKVIREMVKEQKKDKKLIGIIADDFNNFLPIIKTAGIVYSRFFLHSISNEEILKILANTKKYFCAEARAFGDVPKLYPGHERNFIDTGWLISNAVAMGFEVIYFYEDTGLAKYNGEDPLVARIVLKRKVWKE